MGRAKSGVVVLGVRCRDHDGWAGCWRRSRPSRPCPFYRGRFGCGLGRWFCSLDRLRRPVVARLFGGVEEFSILPVSRTFLDTICGNDRRHWGFPTPTQ